MRAAEKNKRKKGNFSEKNFFRNFCKKALALFLSWGIFLPVDGNDRDDNRRQPLSSGKSKAKTKIKNFEKSP
jgi:ribosomal protein S20